MEDSAYVPVYDEGRQMTLGDFFVAYGTTLPQLITITEGFYGRTKYDDFTNGQVLYIADYTKQRCLLAKELQSKAKTRFFSIPLDTPYLFKVIRSHKKAEEPAALRDVIKTHNYPIMAQFAPNYSQLKISGCKENAQSFNNLLLTQEFEEIFLRSHCIENGEIGENINLMALSRNISCAVVTGIEGKTEKQFRSHLSDLNQKVADVKLDKSVGNPELKWMSDDGRGIDIFIPDLDLPQLPQEFADKTPQPPIRMPSINNDVSDDDIYEPPPEHLEPRVQPTPPPPMRRIQHPQLPEIPIDTRTQVRTKKSSESSTNLLPKPKTTEPSKLPHYSTSPVTEDEYIFSDVVDPEFDNHKDPREDCLSFSDKKPSLKPREKPDLPKTPIPVRNKTKTNHVYENSINVVHPMTKSPKSTTHLKGNEPQMAEDEYIEADNATPTADDMYQEFGVDRPKKTCTPPLPEPDVVSRTRYEGSVAPAPRPWLDDLKVCEVGDVLKQLKLGHYVDRFAADWVSGSILGEYDDEILKEEYNFGKIETIRLMKFIRSGHIPQ